MSKTAPEVPDTAATWSGEDVAPGDVEEALRRPAPGAVRARRRPLARAGAQPGCGDRPRVARRDHEPARAGGPLPRVADHPVHGRAGAHDDRRVGADDRRRRRSNDGWPSCASASCSRWARSTSKNLDTIVDPLVVTDSDARVVAARSCGGGGRPAAPRPGRAVDSVNEPDAAARAPAREGAGTTRRGGPGVAAEHPVARAGGGHVRPAALARGAGRIDAVTIRHHPSRARPGVLFFGWLARGSAGGGHADGGERRRAGTGPRPPRRRRRSRSSPNPARRCPALRAWRSTPRPARRSRSTAGRAGSRPAAATRRATSSGGRSWAPRAARAASSARGSARRCCGPHVRRRARLRRGAPAVNADIRVSDDPAREAAELLVARGRARGAHRRVDAAGGVRARRRDARGLVRRGLLVHGRAVRAARPRALELRHGRPRAALAHRGSDRPPHARGARPEDGAAAYENELGEFGPEALDLILVGVGRTRTSAPCSPATTRWASASAAWWGSRRPEWRRWCRASRLRFRW